MGEFKKNFSDFVTSGLVKQGQIVFDTRDFKLMIHSELWKLSTDEGLPLAQGFKRRSMKTTSAGITGNKKHKKRDGVWLYEQKSV